MEKIRRKNKSIIYLINRSIYHYYLCTHRTASSELNFFLFQEIVQITKKSGNLLDQCPGSMVGVGDIPIRVSLIYRPSVVKYEV